MEVSETEHHVHKAQYFIPSQYFIPTTIIFYLTGYTGSKHIPTITAIDYLSIDHSKVILPLSSLSTYNMC